MLDFTFKKILLCLFIEVHYFVPTMYLHQYTDDKTTNTVKHTTLTTVAGYIYFCSEFSCSHSKSLNLFIKDK